MARRRAPDERKLRTREHVLADLSANFVEKQALLCGYAIRREQQDYGTDLVVQTFNDKGEVEPSRILFQLKATDRLVTLKKRAAVSCRVERADLAQWLVEPIPVVLVLYDGNADSAYWLYVQRHFATLPGFDLARCGQRVSVAIPRTQILNPEAMRALARAKNAAAEGIVGVHLHVV